jgi:hypothetical protein
VEYKSLESLSNDFLSLINNKEYSDVTFIVGKDKKPVFAHRMILAKRSVYFRKLFESGMKESVDKEIEKSNISHTTFLVLMRYFYCGCLELNISNVLPVLAAADELTLSELKNFCVVFVTEHIDSDNALELLDMAYKYHSDVLIESCYEYIKNNSVDVLANDSFFKISSGTLQFLLESEYLGVSEIEIFVALVFWGIRRMSAIEKIEKKGTIDPDECVTDEISDGEEIDEELESSFLGDYIQGEAEKVPTSKFIPIPRRRTGSLLGKLRHQPSIPNSPLLDGRTSPQQQKIQEEERKNVMQEIKKYHILPKEKLATLKHILEQFLPLIRFPVMEAHQLTDIVEPFGIVEDKILLLAYRNISAPERNQGDIRCQIRRGLSDALSTQFENSRILSEEHKRILLDYLRTTDEMGKVKRKKWILKYKASKDGFDCKVFHKLCDGKGKSIVLCHTKDTGYIFGGYNSQPWSSEGGWKTASDCWLFSLVNPFKDGARKLKVKNPSRAVYNHPQFGPTFGGGGGLSYFDPYDIYINETMSKGHTNLGNAYATYKGGWRSEDAQKSLAGSLNSWTLDEVEVFILV